MKENNGGRARDLLQHAIRTAGFPNVSFPSTPRPTGTISRTTYSPKRI